MRSERTSTVVHQVNCWVPNFRLCHLTESPMYVEIQRLHENTWKPMALLAAVISNPCRVKFASLNLSRYSAVPTFLNIVSWGSWQEIHPLILLEHVSTHSFWRTWTTVTLYSQDCTEVAFVSGWDRPQLLRGNHRQPVNIFSHISNYKQYTTLAELIIN